MLCNVSGSLQTKLRSSPAHPILPLHPATLFSGIIFNVWNRCITLYAHAEKSDASADNVQRAVHALVVGLYLREKPSIKNIGQVSKPSMPTPPDLLRASAWDRTGSYTHTRSPQTLLKGWFD